MARVKNGRIFPGENKNRESFGGSPKKWAGRLWVEDADGSNERCWQLTEADIKKFDARAKRNPEDATHKDFLTDLLD